MRKLGFKWNRNIFVELTISMGVCSRAYICQRITNAINYMYTCMVVKQ